MKHCHYPSIQRASASDSPRSALLRKALSRLDETIYHIYNNNEEDANKRVIATAASILQLPQIICLSDDVVAMGHGSGPQPAASTPDTEESLDTGIGGFGDAGGPGADGKDDGLNDEDDERVSYLGEHFYMYPRSPLPDVLSQTHFAHHNLDLTSCRPSLPLFPSNPLQ